MFLTSSEDIVKPPARQLSLTRSLAAAVRRRSNVITALHGKSVTCLWNYYPLPLHLDVVSTFYNKFLIPMWTKLFHLYSDVKWCRRGGLDWWWWWDDAVWRSGELASWFHPIPCLVPFSTFILILFHRHLSWSIFQKGRRAELFIKSKAICLNRLTCSRKSENLQ